MSCKVHDDHAHTHGDGCGHLAVKHDDHVDYLHDGHLHHVHGEHVDEHCLSDSGSECTPEHSCGDHEAEHKHGDGCGHHLVPHGDHMCYVVNGHLHHSHDGHCDDHGGVDMA